MFAKLIMILSLSFILMPSSYAGQLHFQVENDAPFDEDGNYSSGLIFGWESEPAKLKTEPSWIIHHWQQQLLFPQLDANKAWGLKVSQRMWTPDEIKISVPQPTDRPYAGFLEFEQHTALYSSSLAQKNWLSVGVIGSSSGTEQLQEKIHKVLGASTPGGWSYQIENEITFQLGYEIDYLLLRQSAPFNSQWELSTYNHNTLGNFRSDINVGLSLRWGTALQQSFGRLSSHFGHVGNLLTNASPHSLLFFTRLQLGYRFNDLTIDGDLPYQSHVDLNHNLASAVTGASYYFPGGAVTWSFNFYNKEHHSDDKSWRGYGVLQFSWSL